LQSIIVAQDTLNERDQLQNRIPHIDQGNYFAVSGCNYQKLPCKLRNISSHRLDHCELVTNVCTDTITINHCLHYTLKKGYIVADFATGSRSEMNHFLHGNSLYVSTPPESSGIIFKLDRPKIN
jgi:hypothetical protein